MPGVDGGRIEGERETARGAESPVVKVAIAVTSQAAVLSAVLYYFGWSRTEALLNYYGLDSTLVDLTTRDYLIRSLRPITPIVVGTGVAVLLAVSIHRGLTVPALDQGDRSRGRVTIVCRVLRAVCWLALGLVAASLLFVPDGFRVLVLLQPVVLTAAALVLAYTDVLTGIVRGKDVPRSPGPVDLRRCALVGLVLVGSIWSLSVYAATAGRGSAITTQALGESPDVVVRSTQQILNGRPGVTEIPIATPDAKFRYAYIGVKVLIRAGGKYYLLPTGWQPEQGSVIILPDNDSIQVDVVRRAG